LEFRSHPADRQRFNLQIARPILVDREAFLGLSVVDEARRIPIHRSRTQSFKIASEDTLAKNCVFFTSR